MTHASERQGLAGVLPELPSGAFRAGSEPLFTADQMHTYALAAMAGLGAGCGDSNVEAVRSKMLNRSHKGVAEYGVNTQRSDYSRDDWLRELQAELMDGAVYIEAALSNCSCPSGDGSLRWPCPQHPAQGRDVIGALADRLSALERQSAERIAEVGAKYGEVVAKYSGAVDHLRLMFDAKEHWRERAERAEAALVEIAKEQSASLVLRGNQS